MSQDLHQITQVIIGAAIEVHRELGPGLLESTYESCLHHELMQTGMNVSRQVGLPVVYKGIKLEAGYRIDLLVEESVMVEVKAMEALAPIHTAQLLSYLRLARLEVGLLLNFNTTNLTQHGLKRVVNHFSGTAESDSTFSAISAVNNQRRATLGERNA